MNASEDQIQAIRCEVNRLIDYRNTFRSLVLSSLSAASQKSSIRTFQKAAGDLYAEMLTRFYSRIDENSKSLLQVAPQDISRFLAEEEDVDYGNTFLEIWEELYDSFDLSVRSKGFASPLLNFLGVNREQIMCGMILSLYDSEAWVKIVPAWEIAVFLTQLIRSPSMMDVVAECALANQNSSEQNIELENKYSSEDDLNKEDCEEVISHVLDFFYQSGHPDTYELQCQFAFSGFSPYFPDRCMLLTREQAEERLWGALKLFAFDSVTSFQIFAFNFLLSHSTFLQPKVIQDDSKEKELLAQLKHASHESKDFANRISRLEKKVSVKTDECAAMAREVEILKQRLRAREAELEEVREEKARLQKDADDLLAAFEEHVEEADETEFEETDLDGKRVLSCGGHPSFVVPLQELVPELEIYATRRPELPSLVNADAVFIQPNHIGHSDFYWIKNACQRHDIPVFIYNSYGARNCARQIERTMRALEKK